MEYGNDNNSPDGTASVFSQRISDFDREDDLNDSNSDSEINIQDHDQVIQYNKNIDFEDKVVSTSADESAKLKAEKEQQEREGKKMLNSLGIFSNVILDKLEPKQGNEVEAPAFVSQENVNQLKHIRDKYYDRFFPRSTVKDYGQGLRTLGNKEFFALFHILNLIENSLQLLCQFSLDVFRLSEPICKHDQAIIIKEASMVSIVIRHSITFNAYDKTFSGINGSRYNMSDWTRIGCSQKGVEYCYGIFEQLRQIFPASTSKPELAGLLTIIVMFSANSKRLKEPEKINRVKKRFKELLKNLCQLNEERSSSDGGSGYTYRSCLQYKELCRMIDTILDLKLVLARGLDSFLHEHEFTGSLLLKIKTIAPLCEDFFNTKNNKRNSHAKNSVGNLNDFNNACLTNDNLSLSGSSAYHSGTSGTGSSLKSSSMLRDCAIVKAKGISKSSLGRVDVDPSKQNVLNVQDNRQNKI